jgi:long-chain acyl-CoA synthetase
MRKRISLETVTIIDILEAINKNYGDIPALQIADKDGSFRRISYVELGRRTVDISSNLIKWGITKGDRIAIYSENRPEWVVALFGIICSAAITVPIDTKLSESEARFILSNSEARCIFVSKKYLDTVTKIKASLPRLEFVVALDDCDDPGIIRCKDLKLASGEDKNRPIYEDDSALIIYTSGTTGVAKGVELTYRNLLFQVKALSEIVRYKTQDRFLSILPLNHTLELTGGLIAPLYAGACITYCDSLKPSHMLALMKETKTTMMICVPLVIKMLHDGAMDKVAKMPVFQQRVFNSLLGVSKWFLKRNIRIGCLFFSAVHKEFGGRLRGFVSGGAPLNNEVELSFSALGFWILQGYGLTETSPVISVNTYKAYRFGSVGRPLPGLRVKILAENSEAKDGEILTRGHHIMRGYFRDPEKTAEVIKDGWLHTGDIGHLDKDGFLYITGRIRNLIVLGAGKKVFPEEVEQVMSRSPLIKEICVLGRVATKGLRKGCEEVYAVVAVNLDMFTADERKNPDLVKKKIASEISRLGADLAEYKKIGDFEVWPEELPKTASRKIKRKALADIIAVRPA